MPADRMMPADVDAEQAVLGSMLQDATARDDAATLLRPDDFWKPLHARVFVAVLGMVDAGERIDATLVAARLAADGGDPVDREFLLHLQAEAPLLLNVRAHARVVASHASRRKLLGAAAEISEAALDVTTELPDVVALARTLVDRADLPLGGGPDIDVDSFLATPHDYDWLVPGLIERLDRTLIVAEEGAGKSMLLRQIAVQCSQGIHPFTLASVPPMRVLIVDLENNPRLSARKIEGMRNAAKLSVGERYDPLRLRMVLRPEGLDVTQRGDALWLTERVAANRPDLVCIGPLYKLHEADESDSTDVRQVQKVLDRIRTRYRCALWMETHAPHESFSKGGRLRPAGSRLWVRWPEFILTLQAQARSKPGTPWLLDHGRPPRDEREWPRQLLRGGKQSIWPWQTPASTLLDEPGIDDSGLDDEEPFAIEGSD